ncbi:MAG: sigma-70 family RNA polymerase sigma factor [Patescibacteria group bacterium]|nr:sigma-70 family RNA polymerase sigma factor [Patescibacteria group bacterium]
MPSSASLSNEELARQAQLGCMASFEELVLRLQAPLVHFLRQTARKEEADDLAQDTFLRAYENLNRYDGSSRFSTWLFTIGRRLCLNANRRTRPEGDPRLADALLTREPSPSSIAADREHKARLWQVAARLLKETEYTTVWLHYVEGMATAEIAEVVGCSRTAAKTMLFRSRRKLTEALEQLDPADPDRNGASDRAAAIAHTPNQTATARHARSNR